MRTARVRPVNRAHYIHCMGRVGGMKDWLPFGDVEKAYMIKLWKHLCSFYTVVAWSRKVTVTFFERLVD